MKKLLLAGTLASICFAGLPGCTKQSEGPAKTAAIEFKPITFQPFDNLSAFKGKAPEQLLVDELVGPRLRAILPQEQVACAKEVFNYMPDLELKPDGSLHAELNGSRAEGWRHGLVNLQPTGQINLLLDCSFEEKGAQPYYLFTNRDVADKPDKAVMEWARDAVVDNATFVLLSNGVNKRETTITGMFEKEVKALPLAEQNGKLDVNKAASEPNPPTLTKSRQESIPPPPPAIKTEPRQAVAYIRAGAIACGNPKSFFKVAAIERTNNPYVSLPGDCETVPANIQTTFTRYVSTPFGSDMIQVGTYAGVFYVRNYDVVY